MCRAVAADSQERSCQGLWARQVPPLPPFLAKVVISEELAKMSSLISHLQSTS
jgi:hypothetical protein